ncbi:MAG: AI-2E family transporter [Dehalococcoidales bacterium]|nr:AI-2E family transporter [Dehalococcoidales bacterium]MDD4229786.1 AI-2E family transporter [Dehalococcoidales bacterium]MDD4465196.1 AI-2E family transporter [Dehalococcoidales bacterium]
MIQALKNNWRLVVFLAAAFIFLVLAWAWRGVLLPFVIGLILAYLMLPGVNWLEKKLPPKNKCQKARRIAAILIVFVITIGIVGGILSYVIITVIQTFIDLFSRAPEYISTIMDQIQQWADSFQQQLPPGLQTQVEQMIANLGLQMESVLENLARGGFSFISGTVGALLGFAALPLFLFYIIKDYSQIKRNIYSFIPEWTIEHTRNITSILDKVLGGYIKATLVLGGIVAVMSFIGLSILRVPYAPALAFFAGITEMIPTIGPWIGGGLAFLVTLSTAPEKAILVVVLFIGVQLVENNLLVPRIQGGYMRIHPAAVLMLLVLGAHIAGIWGIIISIPIAATVARIVQYIRDRRAVHQKEELPQETGVVEPENKPA